MVAACVSFRKQTVSEWGAQCDGAVGTFLDKRRLQYFGGSAFGAERASQISIELDVCFNFLGEDVGLAPNELAE